MGSPSIHERVHISKPLDVWAQPVWIGQAFGLDAGPGWHGRLVLHDTQHHTQLCTSGTLLCRSPVWFACSKAMLNRIVEICKGSLGWKEACCFENWAKRRNARRIHCTQGIKFAVRPHTHGHRLFCLPCILGCWGISAAVEAPSNVVCLHLESSANSSSLDFVSAPNRED
jgi:hypothetical protein